MLSKLCNYVIWNNNHLLNGMGEGLFITNYKFWTRRRIEPLFAQMVTAGITVTSFENVGGRRFHNAQITESLV